MHAGVEPTFAYFETHFGFSEREAVAILGAHSLGEAQCVPVLLPSCPLPPAPTHLFTNFHKHCVIKTWYNTVLMRSSRDISGG